MPFVPTIVTRTTLPSRLTETVATKTAVVNTPLELSVVVYEPIIEDSTTLETVIALVSGSDYDGGDITYISDDTTNFIIGETSGIITLTTTGVSIVNSGQDLPDFTVTATSSNSEGSVVIILPSTTTVNDDIIVSATLVADILTQGDITTSTVIATISATDEDGGEIVYSLATEYLTYYAVDSSSGVITLTEAGVGLLNSLTTPPSLTAIATSDNSSGSVSIDPSSIVVLYNTLAQIGDLIITNEDTLYTHEGYPLYSLLTADGSTFDENAYPELYTILGTNTLEELADITDSPFPYKYVADLVE